MAELMVHQILQMKKTKCQGWLILGFCGLNDGRMMSSFPKVRDTERKGDWAWGQPVDALAGELKGDL